MPVVVDNRSPWMRRRRRRRSWSLGGWSLGEILAAAGLAVLFGLFLVYGVIGYFFVLPGEVEEAAALVNKLRAEHGLPPLKLVNFEFAWWKARKMWSRELPYDHCHGETTYERDMTKMGIYVYTLEALAKGHLSLASAVYGWYKSKLGHRDILLDRCANEVALARAGEYSVLYAIVNYTHGWRFHANETHIFGSGFVRKEVNVTKIKLEHCTPDCNLIPTLFCGDDKLSYFSFRDVGDYWYVELAFERPNSKYEIVFYVYMETPNGMCPVLSYSEYGD
jgi:Uncharacterized protein with SCP/PR1 domains